MSASITIQYTGVPDADLLANIEWWKARGYAASGEEIVTRLTLAPPIRYALTAGDEGVDVSKWNWPVDFAAVAGAGRRFAYIRATMGVPSPEYTGIDERFAEHWRNTRAAGLLVAPYHLFIWNIDGRLQAEHAYAYVRATVGELGDLPFAVDVEPRAVDTVEVVDKNVSTANLVSFITRMQELSGKRLVLYTNPWAWERMTTQPAWLRDQLLWLADWTPPQDLPPHASFVWMHQYRVAEPGDLDWHPGRLDLDRYTGDDPPAPGPEHTLADKTNQQVINLFYRAFGEDLYIGKLVTAVREYQGVLFGQRQAFYTGPSIESMTLSNSDQNALIRALEAQ